MITANDKASIANKKGSIQQQKFMKCHRIHHRIVVFVRMLLAVLFLVFWEAGTRFGIIDAFFFSSPSRLFTLMIQMIKDNSIFLHTGITLLETLISFFLVFIVSLVFATILWYSPRLSEILEPFWVMLNALPKSALAPLFIVWLGTGTLTIITAGLSVAIFGSIISFYTAFKQCDSDRVKLIKTLGGTRTDAFLKVVLPSSVPLLLSVTKVNIGLSLVGVIIGEFLASKQGLGYLIIYGSQVFQLNLVILNIVILSFIAMGLYQGIQSIEHLIKKKMGVISTP